MYFTQFQRNRLKLDLELRDSVLRKYFSPALLCLDRALIPRLRNHASGKLLDAGCGAMPFKGSLTNLVEEYHSIDIERKVPEVDFVGDLQDMKGVADESYDVILCTEVLEHVPQPEKLIAEVWRVLKSRGKFILSVPHLSRLHDEPFDYYRFTKHGLQFLLEQNGFSVLEIVPTGSLFSLLGHQVSTALVGSTWHIPVLGRLVFFLNAALCTLPCYALDRLLPISGKCPLGYVAVAEKSNAITVRKYL
jgi:2-polyprenyl-3-methyl-5-hydroxy-6-metoxy-1,4-benzoquinol methylase